MTFPLGPYHPALAQPFALTLRLRGETIVGVEPLGMGYCHRDVVGLVEGKTPDEALPIIERTCSTAHESYRIAFCQALESAAHIEVDSAAQQTRVLFAEIERLLARLWTMSWVSRAANLGPLSRQALDQREALYTALTAATGARHYWGVTIPGGVRADLDLAALQEPLKALEPAMAVWGATVAPNGLLGRAGKGIGSISPAQARLFQLSGLAGRGSYTVDDLRTTQPYASYADCQEQLGNSPSKPAGDVAARLACVAVDMLASHTIAQTILDELVSEEREVATLKPLTNPSADREASSSVEGPHGALTLGYTQTSAGVLHDLTITTPNAALLEALPQLLEGRLLPQVPLILASLDICIECFDL